MSIYSVHARMADIQQQLVPPQIVRSAQSEQTFQIMLERSIAGKAVDVAAAMAQSDDTAVPAAQQQSSPTMYVASVRQGVAAGFPASWTGAVDTSDGMLEKAAPYMDIIRDASSVYGIPVNVIMGVIKAESDYDVHCVSHSGAMGLMQIMPVNAEYFGVTDAYDPRQNIMCGTEEIARHLRSYNGDLKLALAAYNTGAGNVARRGVTSSDSEAYNTIPASVRAYADRVLRYAGLAS